jgi:hypothetical protein
MLFSGFPPGFRDEHAGPHTFPGNPVARVPRSPTPLGPRARPFRLVTAVFAVLHGLDSRGFLSGLNRAAHGLAVLCFASDLTIGPRQTRFPLLARLYGAGFGPPGSNLRFQSFDLFIYFISSSLNRASCRTERVGVRV